MEEAIELIKQKCIKENINTIDKFNNKISIHYDLDTIINRYLNLLDKSKNQEYEQIQNKKVDFLVEMIRIFNFEELDKKVYISNFINTYIQSDEEFYVEKIIKAFTKELPEMKDFLNSELTRFHFSNQE
jgi:hypothetical protein